LNGKNITKKKREGQNGEHAPNGKTHGNQISLFTPMRAGKEARQIGSTIGRAFEAEKIGILGKTKLDFTNSRAWRKKKARVRK